MYTQRMVQPPEVHPRTVLSTKRSPRAQISHAKSRGTRDKASRGAHACASFNALRQAHHRFLIFCIRCRINNPADHPMSNLDWLIEAGSERENRGDYALEVDRFRGIYGKHEGHETAKVRGVQRTGGGRGLRGESGNRVDGVFPGRPHSFPYQRRPVDGRSPGRRGMPQVCGTRSGTIHAETDLSILPFPLLDVEYLVRFASEWCFLLRDYWLDFDIILYENSINQIKQNQIASPP